LESNYEEEVVDELSTRLTELLNESDNESNGSNRSKDSLNDMQRNVDRSNKYNSHHTNNFDHRSAHKPFNYTPVHTPQLTPQHNQPSNSGIPHFKQPTYPPKGEAPTLAELEQKGQYQAKEHLRDVNQVNTSEYDIEEKKRELKFKFDLLKKSYPKSQIPEFTIHSDYNEMKKSYGSCVRRLSLDSSVESYKTYLIGGFMVVEFIFGKFLKLDMQGFTQQQIVSMHSYEKLLIELGEKAYTPKGSKWPVELRLLFLILMNAAMFIVSKMIMAKTGTNFLGMINGMNAAASRPAPSQKRRMRGPNINLEDIP